jgi:hypothetical protein
MKDNDAVNALHFLKVDNSVITNSALLEDMDKLRKWWNLACDSVNRGKPHRMLGKEDKYVLDWCVNLAKELVDAESAYRSNLAFDEIKLKLMRQSTWEKFTNLEKGLTSYAEERGI